MSVMRAPAPTPDPIAKHSRLVAASVGATQRSGRFGAGARVKAAGLLAQDARPVLVAFGDTSRNVLGPVPLHGRIVVEVEFAIDDPPMPGIALGGIVLRYG